MPFPRTAAVAAALAASGVIAASSAASTSHTKLWTNPKGLVACGIMNTSPPNTEVLCSSQSIPAPPHSNASQGDPGFVRIGKTGKPKLLRLSQDSFVGTHATKLHAGTTWSGLGVTCQIASKSVTCTNKSSHGFEINGSKKYRSF
jgi:disulfide bond formation protein DsbB